MNTKSVLVQCDRCGKIVDGFIYEDTSSFRSHTIGFFDVTKGFWEKFARWEESNVCRDCMYNDPKYKMWSTSSI